MKVEDTELTKSAQFYSVLASADLSLMFYASIHLAIASLEKVDGFLSGTATMRLQ